MKVRDRGRIKRFRNMLRVAVKHPCLITSLPMVGSSEVWAYDGRAYVFPGCGGLLVLDWFAFMRHVRRHR